MLATGGYSSGHGGHGGHGGYSSGNSGHGGRGGAWTAGAAVPVKRRRSRSKRLAAIAKQRRLGAAGTTADAEQGQQEYAEDVEQYEDPEEAGGAGLQDKSGDFEWYYRGQRILDTSEWLPFMRALRKPLPVTFRVNRTDGPAAAGIATLESALNSPALYPAAKHLPWVDAWQLPCSAMGLKFSPEASWAAVRSSLSQCTAVGGVTRQEIVSMIPVAFLGVEPHHAVLDMCAAPGSKTTQALRVMAPDSSTGWVVANDADPTRGYMLVRRCAAVGLESSRLLVTHHKAQKFPNVWAGLQPGTGPFDRIICDVPCCGDGTLRKSPMTWRRWHPEFALGLHSLQLQIAMRGIALLKVGGIITYSTCTFNPVENEAVVAELLNRFQGRVELLDVSSQHRVLSRRPGISNWFVADDSMQAFVRYEEACAKTFVGPHRRKFRRSMWPPSNASQLPLSRCMRFYPHLQDTGGFFVAVLRKTAPLDAGAYGPVPRHMPVLSLRHTYQRVPVASLTWLQSFFQLDKHFQKHIAPCLWTRSDVCHSIHYVTPHIGDAILQTPNLVRQVSAGVKLVTEIGDLTFLSVQGAALLGPHAKSRVFPATASDLRVLSQSVRDNSHIGVASSCLSAALSEYSCSVHESGPCFVVAASGRHQFWPAYWQPPYLRLTFVHARGLEHLPRALADAVASTAS